MTIKHLVISGGGPIMLQNLAIIQYLERNEFMNINNIESIYGTSAGAIVGVLICLKFDWDTINDYIIKRPWKDVFNIKTKQIFESYTKKGIFDEKTVEKCFKPLFDAKDMSMHITLKEFYEKTNIDLHMYSFEINEYKTTDISHKTHPELYLLTAIQMTCAIPVLLSPVCHDNKCYIDGGLACNYPLDYCIKNGNKEDEILAFKNKYNREKITIINSESNILEFIVNVLFKALFSMNKDNLQPNIQNEIICDAEFLSIELLTDALTSIETRKKIFDIGTETAKKFLDSMMERKEK